MRDYSGENSKVEGGGGEKGIDGEQEIAAVPKKKDRDREEKNSLVIGAHQTGGVSMELAPNLHLCHHLLKGHLP